MSSPDVTHFHSVDVQADQRNFLEFIDRANALEITQNWKRRMLELLELAAGARVLDAGCGAGDDSREIARRIQPGGESVGVDASSFLLSVAEARSREQGVPVTFRLGDTARLEFPDNSFDAVRAERVLMHVAAPDRAIAEMARVAKPGGRVVALDFDWDMFVIDHPDVEFSRAAVRAFCDSIASGTVGRGLPRYFRRAHLMDVTVEGFPCAYEWSFFGAVFSGAWEKAVASGALPEAKFRKWWKELEESAQSGEFFAMNVALIVAGRKPAA